MNLIQLFELCLKAKEVGVDAFFDYLPHIDGVNLRVYENGWGLLRDEHGELVRDENGETIVRNYDRNFYIYTDSELFKEDIDDAGKYLTELISIKKKELNSMEYVPDNYDMWLEYEKEQYRLEKLEEENKED